MPEYRDLSMSALSPSIHRGIFDFTVESAGMFGDLEGIDVVFVGHAFENVLPLLQAIDTVGRLRAVIIKNSTGHLHPQVVERMREAGFPVAAASKADFTAGGRPSFLADLMEGPAPLLILDHGGYFAYGEALDLLSHRPGGLIGVVEYTLNGEERYVRRQEGAPLPCPVLSTAQSRVKAAGDVAVAEAIVLEADVLLSRVGVALAGKRTGIGVVGQGRLGTAIAESLMQRGARRVWVDDFDPVRRAGQRSVEVADTAALVAHCDIIFLATGNHALTPPLLALAREDTVFFTVTSADDELDLEGLVASGVLVPEPARHPLLATYRVAASGRRIHLGFDGDAPNMHSAFGNTDPTIHLPNAAHVAAGVVLARHLSDFPHDVAPIPPEIEQVVADVFEESYREASTIH